MRIALLQTRSRISAEANAAHLEPMVREAVGAGAQLILTPEASNILQRDAAQLLAAVTPAEDDPMHAMLCSLAAELGVWILAGSLMVRGAERARATNRAHVISAEGVVTARYDKIHMFNVALGAGEMYSEADAVAPGGEAVVAETPWGGLGLSICYDVRFPSLYRALALAGAKMIAVPAAFTRPTGKAHWEVLLRARAIETGTFILAPAQGGRHEDGRSTWGRSMVVGPWGEIIAQFDHDEPGILTADLDLTAVQTARGRIPSLQHERTFSEPNAGTAL